MTRELNRLNDVFFKYLLGDSKKEIPDPELYQQHLKPNGKRPVYRFRISG